MYTKMCACVHMHIYTYIYIMPAKVAKKATEHHDDHDEHDDQDTHKQHDPKKITRRLPTDLPRNSTNHSRYSQR